MVADPNTPAAPASRLGLFWRQIFLPFASSRLLLIIVAWAGFYLAPMPSRFFKREIGRDGMLDPIAVHLSPDVHPLINMWSRWDSEWYLDIAQHGYHFTPGKESNVAFFPLYPYAVRLLHALVPLPHDAGWLLLGILLSNGALLVALIYLHRLVRLDFEDATATRAVLCLCFFPTTLFLSAFYSEGLYLAVVVSAFFYARQSRWLLAGILAAFAAIGRPPGGLLAVALAFEYFAQKGFQWQRLRPHCLIFLLSPLALLAHLAHLRWRFGAWNILAQAEGVNAWSRHFTFPWMTLGTFPFRPHSGLGTRDSYLDLVCTLGLIGLTTVSALRLRRSYALYAVTTVCFITSWGFLNSVPRFAVVIFPAMIALAVILRDQTRFWIYLTVSAIFASASMFAFSHWGWVG